MQESDLRKNVAELLIVRASGHAYDSQRQYPKWELSNSELKRLLKIGVGGVIFFGGTTNELEQRSKTIRSLSEKQLLLCADIEEGLGQRFQGGTWLAPPFAVGSIYRQEPERAISLAERYGICTGSQARRCGLNWVLAPVCDINNNPKNPVINLRAWGEDASTVADLTRAFNRGLSSQGVLSCAKHFPGHGDTSVDSHLELPVLQHDLKRLKEVELLPFKEVIASGADSVMTAHLLLPKIDPHNPATLSEKVISELLRKEVGFDGLLVTDALVMAAIAQRYGCGEAAVMAFHAGADLLMMPENPDEAIKAICEALLSGRIPLKRLEKALERREKALTKVNMFSPMLQKKDNSLSRFELESAEDQLLVDELINSSIEIRTEGNFAINNDGINLLRIDGIFPCPFLSSLAPALLIPEKLGYRTVVCHQLGVNPWQENPDEPLALDRFGDGTVFLQLFMRGNPFRGDSYKNEPWLAAIRQLQRHNRLSGLIVYGCPYLWKQFAAVLAPSIPYAYSPAQNSLAQERVLSSLVQEEKMKRTFHPKNFSEFTD